jgi:DNA-binding response OmpR family regulator
MNKKILVVDDDQDILDAIRFVLEEEGYTVTTTDKGEYVENLHDKNGGLPALILLDVLLSGKDGRLICKKLKSNKETKKIPIIMISAHPSAKKSIKKVGANEFLAKPFQVDELLRMVKKYVKYI